MNEIKMTLGAARQNLPLKMSAQKEMELQTGQMIAMAETAERLRTARRIGLTGDAQGGAQFDGGEDVSLFASVETLSNEELEAMLK